MADKRRLEQSILRHEKTQNSQQHDQEMLSDEAESVAQCSQRLTRKSRGCILDKNLCVWCMKPDGMKHPDTGLLSLL